MVGYGPNGPFSNKRAIELMNKKEKKLNCLVVFEFDLLMGRLIDEVN